jgi:Mn-containing catalase
MFFHNKALQYKIRVSETNPGLANLMLEQFGGPQGELAAACRYFTQYLSEDDPGRKDMLIDIATEELSHLEMIGTLVSMLNKGAKGRISEGVEKEADLYRHITQGGNDSHVTQVLYGGGTPLVNSAGVPWTAAYIDTIGDPSADLRSNIAAEARAKIVYERLIYATDDPDVKDALTFLMTREIAHQLSFEKALYSIQPNYPPGKLPGMPEFANKYFNMSTGEGDAQGPWNGENFEQVNERERQMAVDGEGGFGVTLKPDEMKTFRAMTERLKSNTQVNPMTGVDLGMTAEVAELIGATNGGKGQMTPPAPTPPTPPAGTSRN